MILLRLNDMASKELALKANFREFDERMITLENQQVLLVNDIIFYYHYTRLQ